MLRFYIFAYYDSSLVGDALGVDPDVVKGERDALDHVSGMLIEVLKELLHILIATLGEKLAVVDVNHYRVKILVLFLLQCKVNDGCVILTHSRKTWNCSREKASKKT